MLSRRDIFPKSSCPGGVEASRLLLVPSFSKRGGVINLQGFDPYLAQAFGLDLKLLNHPHLNPLPSRERK